MRTVGAIVEAAGLLLAFPHPAGAELMQTLRIKAVGCSDCVVTVQFAKAKISPGRPDSWPPNTWRELQLRNGRAQIQVPWDAGWFGLGVQTKAGMSGAGAQTVVAMNYAGYGMGDTVSNRQSRRAPFGTACAYFHRDMTVRFKVQRDRLPKDATRNDPTIGKWKRLLRAWASPQQAPQSTDFYTPTEKGLLRTQNTACYPNL